jgi:hypothetical protein
LVLGLDFRARISDSFSVLVLVLVLEILKLKIPPPENSVGGIFLGALLNLVAYFLLTKT